jgi:hypothetical protein
MTVTARTGGERTLGRVHARAAEPALRLVDDGDGGVDLTAAEADDLWASTAGLDAATVSACPDCRCKIVAALALTDILDAGVSHPRRGDLVDLADDAPTAHLYVVDAATECRHPRWRDPGYEEWWEVVGDTEPRPRR